MSQIFCTFCLTGKLLLDNILLAPPGRVCDVMLLSAPSSAVFSVANIDCLGRADQPRVAWAQLRSCQAQETGDGQLSRPRCLLSRLFRHNCMLIDMPKVQDQPWIYLKEGKPSEEIWYCQAQGQRRMSLKKTKIDPEVRSVMGWPTTTTTR